MKVEVTPYEAQKIQACILLAIHDDEVKIIKEPNDYEAQNRIEFYRKLARKFNTYFVD